ncbi:MAG: hypothetical protein GY796_20170 [Chloroflexi bacterium]|nr:hypothetical protein [Chloroflexota bacterium]
MFEQDRVLVRLQQHVLGEREIVVCFMAGSYGRRREDAYSDMDVALVYTDAFQRDLAWEKRRSFVQSVNPYVSAKSFDAGHVRPYFHIALYSNGTKIDCRYETMTDLQPNPWDRDIRILKDKDGWAEQYQAACLQTLPTRPLITAAELTQLDERFWIMFWDVFRLIMRGDNDKPFPIYLELQHFSLPLLLNILPPEEPARVDLLKAYFMPSTQATASHLRELLAAYLGARTAVIRRLKLQFTPDTRFETEIQKLVERRNS